MDLDFGANEQDLESPPLCLVQFYRFEFSLVLPEEIDKIIGEVRPITSMLDFDLLG